MTPMQELVITCPCCRRTIVFDTTDDSVTVEAPECDIAQMASDLGIELGAMEGGEEIGD